MMTSNGPTITETFTQLPIRPPSPSKNHLHTLSSRWLAQYRERQQIEILVNDVRAQQVGEQKKALERTWSISSKTRHAMMRNIVKLITHRNKHSIGLLRSTPQIVGRLEFGLYRAAKTEEEYTNIKTLDVRLDNYVKLVVDAAADAIAHRDRVQKRHAYLIMKLGKERVIHLLRFIDEIETIRCYAKESIQDQIFLGNKTQITAPPTVLKLFFSTPLVDQWNMIYSKSLEVDQELQAMSLTTWRLLMYEAKQNVMAHREYLRLVRRQTIRQD
jgi:hypothetical protein